jgi:hypothetical protein
VDLIRYISGGRRILGQIGPVGHDGGVYLYNSDDGRNIGRFIQQFPWAKIRNYQIDLLFGPDVDPRSHTMRPQVWDWEVEKYDIRGEFPRRLEFIRHYIDVLRLCCSSRLRHFEQVSPAEQTAGTCKVSGRSSED